MTAPARHTILVVDDEPDVIHSVKDLLRLEHHVVGATSAAEAMEILARTEVHVVMTDQRMPEMSGVELLHEIRGGHPDAIRLLFTGYADIRTVIDAINQGNVYRYITKPWDPEELQSIIREACHRYDLIVERQRLVADLRASNVALERANALKTTFLRVVGHELRTPITLQLGLARLALRTEGLAPPSVRDRLERIERVTRRLSERSEQLMVLLYKDHFARSIDRQPMLLVDLLRGAADDVMPFVERRGQRLVVDAPATTGTISVDAAKIGDSLNQLLLNAIKFTPDGGTVTLSARRTDAGVRIEVTDTGAGIDDASVEHVFQPFFTGFDSDHHSSGQFDFNARGLGLGLSVVRAFVEMHGGSVSFETRRGKGSTFAVDLPSGPPEGAQS